MKENPHLKKKKNTRVCVCGLVSEPLTLTVCVCMPLLQFILKTQTQIQFQRFPERIQFARVALNNVPPTKCVFPCDCSLANQETKHHNSWTGAGGKRERRERLFLGEVFQTFECNDIIYRYKRTKRNVSARERTLAKLMIISQTQESMNCTYTVSSYIELAIYWAT